MSYMQWYRKDCMPSI